MSFIRSGSSTAFEALYDRHHRAILSFCRHLLGSQDEAEDAVQHTFLAAYDELRTCRREIALRPWLFTIARNRCYSILRARREYPTGELPELETEGLATQVQRREDLRDLVSDLARLPDDQRAALVLAEMQSLSHEEIAIVLDVPREKVKSLVFQARQALVASRVARETSCAEIRTLLANHRGGALRRGNLRRHLSECDGCRAYRREVEMQRRRLALVLPVAPTIALKDAVLAATVGGGSAGAAGTGLVAAGAALKGVGAKGVASALLATIGAAGTFVAIHAVPLAPFDKTAPALSHHAHATRQARIAAADPSTEAGMLANAAAAPLVSSAVLRSADPGLTARHRAATAAHRHHARHRHSAGPRHGRDPVAPAAGTSTAVAGLRSDVAGGASYTATGTVTFRPAHAGAHNRHHAPRAGTIGGHAGTRARTAARHAGAGHAGARHLRGRHAAGTTVTTRSTAAVGTARHGKHGRRTATLGASAPAPAAAPTSPGRSSDGPAARARAARG